MIGSRTHRRVRATPWAEPVRDYDAWRSIVRATPIADARSITHRDRVTLIVGRAAWADGPELEHAASIAGPSKPPCELDRGDEVVGPTSAEPIVGPRSVVVAVGRALAGIVVVRWLVLRSPAGALTADEAYTGIESFEILGGHFPVVLGGTVYTLPFEAYLYVPIAALLGANVVILKLLSTVSWALHPWSSSSSRRGSRAVGPASSPRRSVGSRRERCCSSRSRLLGYASGLLVTVGVLVPAGMSSSTPRAEPVVMVGFGVLAGFGFWLHPMFLATLIPMVLVVLWSPSPAHRCLGRGDRRRHRRMCCRCCCGTR